MQFIHIAQISTIKTEHMLPYSLSQLKFCIHNLCTNNNQITKIIGKNLVERDKRSLSFKKKLVRSASMMMTHREHGR